jgi:hypothetical protein
MRERRGVRLVTVAVAFAFACAVASLVVVREATALPAEASANTLLSPAAAAKFVPENLRPLVTRLELSAARVMARQRTNLGKALALERVVHSAPTLSGADCFGYATVMNALGRAQDLPTQVDFGGTGISRYDTHTTVSVWLPRLQRWAVVDPTFGGIFVRAGQSQPLSVVQLQASLRAGWLDQVRWRPSAPDSTPLSSYYIDPLFLFRYVGVFASIAGRTLPLMPSGSTALYPHGYEVSASVFAQDRPGDVQTTRRVDSKPTADTDLPPAYATRDVWVGTVVKARTLQVPKNSSIVVWASGEGTVNGFPMTALTHGNLSPIVPSDGQVTIEGRRLGTVRVFETRRFPAVAERA